MSIKEIRNGATYFFALSIFALAGSIVYFSVQIVTVTTDMPDLLASIDKVNENITPVMDEVAEIRKLIPGMLKEISEARKQIPPILEEVKKVREQVPPILEEAREVRVLVPGVLAEVAATRKALPAMLAQGNKIVSGAKSAGEEAGKGAVKGFFKGIVRAPFELVGGMGKSLASVSAKTGKDLSDDELKKIDLLGRELLDSETIGDKRDWESKDKKIRGRLTLLSIYSEDGQTCKKINTQFWQKKKSVHEEVMDICQDINGDWSVEK